MGLESQWERDFDLNIARQHPSTRVEAPHQSAALQALGEWFDKNQEDYAGALLVLPTGGGKTFTAVRFLCRHPLSDGYKVLWLAHTHHLLEQALDAFGTRGSQKGLEVGGILEPRERLRTRVVSGTTGHCKVAHIRPEDDVVVCTLQTIVRAQNDGHPALKAFLASAGDKLLVVFDEAHHAPAPSYTKLLVSLRNEHPRLKLLGLTATPMYSNQQREGWFAKLFPQGIAYQVSAAKLIAAGILAKPLVESCETHFVPSFNPSDFERWRATFQDVPETIISQLAENQGRNDAIVSRYMERRQDYGQTIMFADRWFQCEYIRDKLRDRGVKADAIYSQVDATGASASERNARAREANATVLDQFRKGELEVLLNVRMLTEGTDVPSVQTVFITRQTTSPILLRQMVGRALRGPQFNGTSTANIVLFLDEWREAIQWAEFDEIWSPEAEEGTSPARRPLPLRIISIELIRRLARRMEAGSSESMNFRELLPVGWFLPEFDTEIVGTDDAEHVREMVLVYEDEKDAYHAFIARLGSTDLSRFAETTLPPETAAGDIESWRREFFGEAGLATSAIRTNLGYLLRHMAQSPGSPPPYVPFEKRDDHDLSPWVKIAVANDWGPRQTLAALDPVYCSSDHFWRALFPTFNQFVQQFRLLVDAEVRRMEGVAAVPDGAIEPAPLLPDGEPSEEVKREVFRRDGQICLCCGSQSRLEVDHIISKYYGGTNHPDNLQILCRQCNSLKSVQEMNFKKSGTLLTAPPAFALAPGFESSDVDELVCDLRRTINMFYRCAAVDEVHYSTRGDSRRHWQVTLRTGNPRGWITEHLEAIWERIREAQREDPALQLQSLSIQGPTRLHDEPDAPVRVFNDVVIDQRPLPARLITARRQVAVFYPDCGDLPPRLIAAKIIRVNTRARTVEVRINQRGSDWEYQDIPFSAIYPAELIRQVQPR